MVQRFLERFQLWRQEKNAERQGTNPLTWFALVAALALVYDAYTLITSHQLPWPALATLPLLIAFLALYIRKSQWAWCFIPVMGVSFLIQLPFIYASSQPRIRSGLWFSLLFGVGFIAYGFIFRKRYYAYLEANRLSRYDTDMTERGQ